MMNEENNNYSKIGVLAVIIFAIVFGTYKYFKESPFDDQLRVYALIDDAFGMQTGTPILTRGFKIGEVSALTLVNDGVVLELLIYKGFNLNKSAQFYTGVSSPFGGQIIEIKGLEKSDDYYRNGDTIQAKFGKLSLRDGIDSTTIKRVEPSLKELSKAVGKILQEYGEASEK